jgi:hypothetical protein
MKSQTQQKWISMAHNILASTAIVLFSTTALLKLYSVLFDSGLVGQKDVVIRFVSTRALLFSVALAELITVWACLKSTIKPVYKQILVFWLSTAFIAYRLYPWLLHRTWLPCKCMGTFQLLNENMVIQIVLQVFLLILFIGSGLLTLLLVAVDD